MASARMLSLMDRYKLGTSAPPHLSSLFMLHLRSLTGARAAGAFLEIDGKKVPLGIPQPSSGSDSGLNRATVPLGRSGTPDEAAAAMLLYVSFSP